MSDLVRNLKDRLFCDTTRFVLGKHSISKNVEKERTLLNSFLTLIKKEVTNFAILFEARHEKTSVLVSDLVGHKPGCIATEDG